MYYEVIAILRRELFLRIEKRALGLANYSLPADQQQGL